ncbi:MAG TPA: ABC transporter permease [Bacillales bacterium]|nr:ABC transporter permease [Bacillales bacterium]
MGRLSVWLMNPVMGKEVKLRFRSFKSFLGILFYLVVLGAVALAFIYLTSTTGRGFGGFRAGDSRMLFLILTMAQMLLIAFMSPGLTAGTISGEREKQTLNILLTTRQPSTAIILSKLLSSLAYLVLMIIASLPLYAIMFLYGGVSPQMVLSTFGIYLLTIFTFGSLGVMFSTLIRKTIVAMITTYGVVLFLTAGTAFLFFFSQAFGVGSYSVSGTVSQQEPMHLFPYIMSALDPLIVLFTYIQPGMAGELERLTNIHVPLWQAFMGCYLVIAIVAVLIAILRLRPRMKLKKETKVESDE